jgi:predicted aspartyl protease
MGEVRVAMTVINPRTGTRSEEMTAVADTGATLSVIPGQILDGLGIARRRAVSLMLADGRRADRHIGDALVAVDGDATACRVIFGEAGDETLLGVTALEQLGLAVDPVRRRLVPTPFRL